MASSLRTEAFHIPTFLCSGERDRERLLARRIVGEGKGGHSSVSQTRLSFRRSIFVFLQLILGNRKRLLPVYDTFKPASCVCFEYGSKIRDFRHDFPVILQLQFLVKMKTKYCDPMSANCQLHRLHNTRELTKAVGVAGIIQSQIVTVFNFLRNKKSTRAELNR